MNLSDGLSLLRRLRSQNRTLFYNDFDVAKVLKELALQAVADHVYSPTTELALISVYALIAAIGFLSNAFILLVILSSRKLLSNPSSLLLVNLMFSDIVMSLFCIPFTLIWFIRRSWSFGSTMCKVIPFLQGLSIFLCSSTIATIAIDRVVRVTGNLVISNRSPVRDYYATQVGLETVLIWTLSVLLALPGLLSQEVEKVSLQEWSVFGRDEFVKCIECMSRTGKVVYAVTIVIAQYIVPVTILLLANYKIKQHLEASMNRLKQAAEDPSQNTDSRTSTDRRYLLREMDRNEKVMRTLFHLATSFMITWLPWTLTNIYIEFADPEMDDTMSLVLVLFHVLAMTSVPLNAFLYGWSNPTVRVEACRLWNLLTEGWTRRSSTSISSDVMEHIQLNSVSPARTSYSLMAHAAPASPLPTSASPLVRQ